MSLNEEHWLDICYRKIFLLKRTKTELDSTISGYIGYLISCNSKNSLDIAEVIAADQIYINLMVEMSKINGKIDSIKYLIYRYRTMYRKKTVTRRRSYLQITDFDSSKCRNRFRFRQDDLIQLRKDLLIPDIVRINDGKQVFTGDEILLAGLWRLSNKGTLDGLVDIMKGSRDFSQWSKAINYFIKHVYENFIHVLEGDNPERYISQFENFAKCIRNRIYYTSCGELNEQNYSVIGNYANIIGFVDCVVVNVTRTGTGPKVQAQQNGVNAPRDHRNIQQAMYNGYSGHGIKLQSMEAPNGLCLFLYGPCTVRDNDSNLLNQSNLNDIMDLCNNLCRDKYPRLEQENFSTLPYILFGDSAYRRNNYENKYVYAAYQPCSMVNHHIFNISANSVRTSVEHAFARTSALFPFLQDVGSMKLLHNKNLIHYYEVATILRNINVILYGSQTNDIYQNYMLPSSVKEYLRRSKDEIICIDSYDRIQKLMEDEYMTYN